MRPGPAVAYGPYKDPRDLDAGPRPYAAVGYVSPLLPAALNGAGRGARGPAAAVPRLRRGARGRPEHPRTRARRRPLRRLLRPPAGARRGQWRDRRELPDAPARRGRAGRWAVLGGRVRAGRARAVAPVAGGGGPLLRASRPPQRVRRRSGLGRPRAGHAADRAPLARRLCERAAGRRRGDRRHGLGPRAGPALLARALPRSAAAAVAAPGVAPPAPGRDPTTPAGLPAAGRVGLWATRAGPRLRLRRLLRPARPRPPGRAVCAVLPRRGVGASPPRRAGVRMAAGIAVWGRLPAA